VAFLIAELWLLARSWDVLVKVHDSLVSAFLVSNIGSAAIEPIQPVGLTQFGLSGILIREDAPERTRANAWLLWTGGFNFIAILVAPLAFLIYAYIALFSEFGVTDALLWIGLALSIVMPAASSRRSISTSVQRPLQVPVCLARRLYAPNALCSSRASPSQPGGMKARGTRGVAVWCWQRPLAQLADDSQGGPARREHCCFDARGVLRR
jgi:hypothetical protein